jgi:hypothetical protein
MRIALALTIVVTLLAVALVALSFMTFELGEYGYMPLIMAFLVSVPVSMLTIIIKDHQ